MENRPAGDASSAQPFRIPGEAAPLEPFPGDRSPAPSTPVPTAPGAPSPGAEAPGSAPPLAVPAPEGETPVPPVGAPASQGPVPGPPPGSAPSGESESVAEQEQVSPLAPRSPAMPGSHEAEDEKMLRELLPSDGPSARRVVTTLLRAILADRGTG